MSSARRARTDELHGLLGAAADGEDVGDGDEVGDGDDVGDGEGVVGCVVAVGDDDSVGDEVVSVDVGEGWSVGEFSLVLVFLGAGGPWSACCPRAGGTGFGDLTS